MILGLGVGFAFSDSMGEAQGMMLGADVESEVPNVIEPEWFTRLMDSPPGSLDGVFLHSKPHVRGDELTETKSPKDIRDMAQEVQERERRKESDRKYRLTHFDEVKARSREYYEKNKDAILKRQREYQKKNRSKITEYKREYQRRDSVKERHSSQMRDWRQNNREKCIGYQRKYRKRRTEWFLGIKSGLSCSVCGQSFPDYPTVIDFHHRDGSRKEGRISSMVTGNVSEDKILAEIEKCTPVCANCHRQLHVDETREKKREAKKPGSSSVKRRSSQQMLLGKRERFKTQLGE